MADAVVVPGGNLGPFSPVPYFAGQVAVRRGAEVQWHEWRTPRPGGGGPQLVEWVRGEIEPVVAGASLLIGKSLGTVAADLAAERTLPAVWLTPLLRTPWVVELYERATAPFLLVGGTGDDEWDGTTARRLTPHVLEVEDANHGLMVPGPLADSIAVLTRLTTAIDEFLDTIGWR